MPATYEDKIITKELLDNEHNSYFVFGDNAQRTGTGGAAKLRHHPRAIGFVTKKAPDHQSKSSFKPDEYTKPFFDQLDQLENIIKNNPSKKYYISRLGAGLANKYNIWELVIKPNLKQHLAEYDNVVFLWNENE